MTKREARERVAFFAYSLCDARLCNEERICLEECSEADRERLNAALKELLDYLYRRMGRAASHLPR